jgi:hypothetical protein
MVPKQPIPRGSVELPISNISMNANGESNQHSPNSEKVHPGQAQLLEGMVDPECTLSSTEINGPSHANLNTASEQLDCAKPWGSINGPNCV